MTESRRIPTRIDLHQRLGATSIPHGDGRWWTVRCLANAIHSEPLSFEGPTRRAALERWQVHARGWTGWPR